MFEARKFADFNRVNGICDLGKPPPSCKPVLSYF